MEPFMSQCVSCRAFISVAVVHDVVLIFGGGVVFTRCLVVGEGILPDIFQNDIIFHFPCLWSFAFRFGVMTYLSVRVDSFLLLLTPMWWSIVNEVVTVSSFEGPISCLIRGLLHSLLSVPVVIRQNYFVVGHLTELVVFVFFR